MSSFDRDASRLQRFALGRIADDIERLAADAGLSHAALARAAGISAGFLSDALRGKAAPSVETLARLAVPLGADLSLRLYPNTGPRIHDRHQARILEYLLSVLHPRWAPFTEVSVTRPARGWIDIALHDERAGLVLATEIESGMRRIEQTVRWSKEKAESLPSSPLWENMRGGLAPRVSQLLLIRRTRANRDVARDFARQLSIGYPAHPQDALAALTGTSPWPGATLVWAQVDSGRVRLIPTR